MDQAPLQTSVRQNESESAGREEHNDNCTKNHSLGNQECLRAGCDTPEYDKVVERNEEPKKSPQNGEVLCIDVEHGSERILLRSAVPRDARSRNGVSRNRYADR